MKITIYSRLVLVMVLTATMWSVPSLAKTEENCSVAQSELPKELPLPQTDSEIRKLVDQANQEYLDQADATELVKVLKEIRDSDDPESHINGLRKARGAGLLMRAIWHFFSADAEPPRKFDNLEKVLGHLQDQIQDKEHKQIKDSAQQAIDAIKAGHGDLAVLSAKEVVDVSQFEHNLKKMVEAISAALDTKGKLALDDYHQVRKEVRMFKSLFELEGELKKSPEIALAAKYCSELSNSLGDVKDTMETEVKSGDKNVGAKFTCDQQVRIEFLLERL